MRTSILKFLVIIFMPFMVNAQADNKSKAILDEVSQKMQAYETIKIDFTYSIENKNENIKDSKSGSLWMKKDKYKLEVTGQTIICDGKTVWTHIKEAEEVQITTPPNDDEALTPNKLLTAYNKNYKSKFIREEKQGGKDVQIIDLTPNKGGKTFYKTRIVIDKANKQIISSTLYDRNGGTYTYTVNKFLPNQTIEETLFTFNSKDYPGVEINDMR